MLPWKYLMNFSVLDEIWKGFERSKDEFNLNKESTYKNQYVISYQKRIYIHVAFYRMNG